METSQNCPYIETRNGWIHDLRYIADCLSLAVECSLATERSLVWILSGMEGDGRFSLIQASLPLNSEGVQVFSPGFYPVSWWVWVWGYQSYPVMGFRTWESFLRGCWLATGSDREDQRKGHTSYTGMPSHERGVNIFLTDREAKKWMLWGKEVWGGQGKGASTLAGKHVGNIETNMLDNNFWSSLTMNC